MNEQKMESIIARITEMEEIYDQARVLMDKADKDPDAFRAFQPQIGKLADYYGSPEWKEAFALDEEGRLLPELKRGVLSEDGIYNLLDRNKELLESLEETDDLSDKQPGIVLCGAQEIETERLILCSFRHEDADSMMRNWLSDEEVQSMYGEPVYTTIEAVDELIDRYVLATSEGRAFRWEVIEKASGECIGQASYFLVDKNNHFGEIEYCIGRAFQGRGYATEATRAVIAYGFEKIRFHKVQICCRPSNSSSQRVIDKCGFVHEGTLRDYFFRNGGYEDRKFFSILMSEYNEQEAST